MGVELNDLDSSIRHATKDPSVSILFVRSALIGAKNMGFDCREILKQADIEPSLLDEEQARISPDQYTRLIQNIWSTTKDEFMGLAHTRCPPGSFAMMCILIVHCETLYQAIKRAARFSKIALGELDIRLIVEGDTATLTIKLKEPLADPNHFLSECILIILHRLYCWLIGQRIVLDGALFDYDEPRHSKEYHAFYCRKVCFNQARTGLQFNRRYLDMPVVQDERSLKQYLKLAPANIVKRPKYDDSYAGKVRTLLNQNEDVNFPSLEKVAADLATTPSTLRRNLKKENTSFREIKDAIRRDISIYLLTESNLSLQMIAEKLGYSETSTFQHTFKKWLGISPGAYRGQLGKDS